MWICVEILQVTHILSPPIMGMIEIVYNADGHALQLRHKAVLHQILRINESREGEIIDVRRHIAVIKSKVICPHAGPSATIIGL